MFTGKLKNVSICRVDGDDSYKFAFGYVVEHASSQYAPGDWFATSLITNVSEEDGSIIVETLNSIYLVDGASIVDIPSAAIGNIRMGTSPKKALAIINGELF